MSSIVDKTGPIKFAKVDTAATATLIAAVTGKALRVLHAYLHVTTAAGTIKFQSDNGVTQTDLTGAIPFAADGAFNPGWSPAGYWETVSGESLKAVLTSTGQVSGFLVYQEVLAG